MKKSYLVFLLMLACTGVVKARKTPDVEIRNHLSECLIIHPVQQVVMDNLVILKTVITQKKSTGECGCLSALVGYTSLTAQDVSDYGAGKAGVLQQGNFLLTGSPESQPFSFVLSVDNRYMREQKLALLVHCTPPL